MPAALRFCVFLFLAVAHADLFVSTTGSDTNTCSTLALACRTIYRALEVIQDGVGGIIQVSEGAYTPATISKNGVPGSPLQLLATGNANITGPMQVFGNYVQLTGFLMTGAPSGNSITSNGSYTVFNQNTFLNCYTGINLKTCSNVSIVGNTFYGLTSYSSILGVVAQYPASDVEIRNNTFHHLGYGAIRVYGRARYTIDNNIIHDTGSQLSSAVNYGVVHLEQTTTGYIRNNLIYDNSAFGIYLVGSADIRILHNTITTGSYNSPFGCNNGTNVTWRNNIAIHTTASPPCYVLYTCTACSIDYDLCSAWNASHYGETVTSSGSATYYSLAEWRALGYSAHSYADATMLSTFAVAAPSFSLGCTANPAYGGGSYVSDCANDLYGVSRAAGRVDIGAIQGCLTAACPALPLANDTNRVGSYVCVSQNDGVKCTGVCSGIATPDTVPPTAYCHYGSWIYSGRCKDPPCSGAPPFNGSWTWGCSGQVSSGSYCYASCSTGYTGSPTCQCNNGSWCVAPTGSCLPADCSVSVPTVSNLGGWSCSGTGHASGDTCTGTCSTHYYGSPLPSASCYLGNWNVTGACKGNNCTAPPPAVANAAWQCTDPVTSGSNCYATCDTGLFGQPRALCTAEVWGATIGNCSVTALPCTTAPTTITGGVWSSCVGTPNNGTCAGTCNAGWVGNMSAVCVSGFWNPLSSSCTQTFCPAANLPAMNGTWGCSGNYTHNTYCYGSCRSGWSGSMNAQCQTGVWNLGTSKCTGNTCYSYYLPSIRGSWGCSGSFPADYVCAGTCLSNHTGSVRAWCVGGNWNTTGACTPIPATFPIGAVVGGAVGALVLAGLGVALVMYWRRTAGKGALFRIVTEMGVTSSSSSPPPAAAAALYHDHPAAPVGMAPKLQLQLQQQQQQQQHLPAANTPHASVKQQLPLAHAAVAVAAPMQQHQQLQQTTSSSSSSNAANKSSSSSSHLQPQPLKPTPPTTANTGPHPPPSPAPNSRPATPTPPSHHAPKKPPPPSAAAAAGKN